jgi:UDP-N-acetyl-D-mannosaminuronic acid dehydrogenase
MNGDTGSKDSDPEEGTVAVVGAGRIGLPWAAVLAVDGNRQVTCIDVDDSVVKAITDGRAPFEEPRLGEYIERGVEGGQLTATTSEDVVSSHEYVVFTVNAPRGRMDQFVETVEGYLDHCTGSQTIVSRTTLPLTVIDRLRVAVDRATQSEGTFAVFPERLAEGKAIEEIVGLPKIVGVDGSDGENAMKRLLAPFAGGVQITDPETAMFVKLIDNAYRDGLFAIANQIAYVADILGLDAHEAVGLANLEYPRNNIPIPGLVGGKCLPKDPHFLMDETICEQPTTPDLFNATRRTNASLPAYVTTELLKKGPRRVALLGITYKRDVSDAVASPVVDIRDRLREQGVEVMVYDPNVEGVGVATLETALDSADLVVLAVNHSAFEGIEDDLDALAEPDATLYDIWGTLDRAAIDLPVDGLGFPMHSGEEVPEHQSEQEGSP